MSLWVKLLVVQFVFRRLVIWFLVFVKIFLCPLLSEAFLLCLSCLELPLYQWLVIIFLWYRCLLLWRVDKVVHTWFLSWSSRSRVVVVVEGNWWRLEITLRNVADAWLLEELPILVIVDFCTVEAWNRWTWFWDRALWWKSWRARSTSRKCAGTLNFMGIFIVLLSKFLPQSV